MDINIEEPKTIDVYLELNGKTCFFRKYNIKEMLGTVVNDILKEKKLVNFPDDYFQNCDHKFQDELNTIANCNKYNTILNQNKVLKVIIDQKKLVPDGKKIEIVDKSQVKKKKPSWLKRFLFGDWAYYGINANNNKLELQYKLPEKMHKYRVAFHANTYDPRLPYRQY